MLILLYGTLCRGGCKFCAPNLILKKRIELINWVLESMKNPEVEICSLIESRMNHVVLTINQTLDIFEADKFS